LLEAAACGLRIASVPAPGPADIFAGEKARAFSVLDDDLGRAIEQALQLPDDPAVPRRYAEGFSWEACTRQFFDHLQAQTAAAVKRISRLREHL
jgi:glycosyltransferase involved in cell wall biosynthesis